MATLNEEQIRAITRRGIEAGFSVDDIEAEINSYAGMSLEPDMSPIEKLTSQFEGTEAIPTEAMPALPEVGMRELIPARIKRAAGVPLTGIAETVGLVDEGTTEGIRQGSEETLVDYLAQDPTAWRAIKAGLVDFGSELIPLAPGGKLGKMAGGAAVKQLGKRFPGMAEKTVSRAGRLAGGVTAAGAEGLVVGVGETVGMPLEDRLKRGALMTMAAAGLGSLGAVKAIAADDVARKLREGDDLATKVLDDYGETGAEGKQAGTMLERARGKLFNDQSPLVRYAKEIAKKIPGGEKLQQNLAIRMAAARTASQMSHHPLTFGVRRVSDNKMVNESWNDIMRDLDPTRHEGYENIPDKSVDIEVVQRDLAGFHFLRRHQELMEQVATAKEALPVLKEQLNEARRLNDADEEAYLGGLIEGYEKRGRLSLEKEANELAGRIGEFHDRYGSVEVTDRYTGTKSLEPGIIGPLAKRVVDFRRASVLDTMGDPAVGVWSRADLDTLKRSGEWHIPFKRAIEELDEADYIDIFGKDPAVAGRTGVAPFRGKRLKGGLSKKSGQRVRDYYQQTPEDAIQAYRFSRKQALRNEVARLSDDLAKAHPEFGIVKEISESTAGVRVFRDGEFSHKAMPKHLEKSLEMLDYKEGTVIARAARSLTNIFRAGATLTLNFAFGNLTRDMFPAAIYSKEGVLPIVGPAMTWAEEAFKVAAGRGVTSPEWQAFLQSFAAHTSLVGGDVYNAPRYLKDVRRQDLPAGKGLARSAMNMAKNPLGVLQKVSAGLERINRFPEFKKARQRLIREGMDADKATQVAGMAAQDITLDFSLGGDLGRTVNMYEAFTNAMLQDVSKFSRSVTESPISAFRTFARAGAALTAPSMYFYFKHKDDPDYQSLPEWEKALFLHLYKREDGKFARIPMPPGLLGMMFSYLPRKAAQAMESGNLGDMKPFVSEAVEQTPLRYVPGINDPKNAFINIFPDALQPVVEALGNWKPFFDRPVISQRYLRLDKQAQRSRYTSNLAKAISDAGGVAGLQLSPIMIDHVFHSYGAGIGRMITGASGSEAGSRLAREDGLLGLPIVGPVAGKFVSQSPWGFGSQPVQEFYDFAASAQQSHATFKMQSSTKRRQDYIDDHPEVLYIKQVNKYRKKLSEMGEQRNAVEASDMSDLEKDDLLIRIDQAVTMMTGSMMEQLYEAIQIDKAIAQGEQ